MIWHDGRIIGDDDLKIGIDDRVFEHGLGLFETMRTWDGRAPLLTRHLARLRSSAHALGIDMGGVRLPDRGSVAALLNAADLGGDVMLRLTMTSGSESGRDPVAWMIARPLPPPEPGLLSVGIERIGGGIDEPVHRHKMLNYWSRRAAFDRGRRFQFDDVLLCTNQDWICEGSRNNVYIIPENRPDVLRTPSEELPLLPGIMRRVAFEFAEVHGYYTEDGVVEVKDLFDAGAVFLTNSVRGVRRVGRIDDRPINSESPHELDRLFAEELPRYIQSLPDEPEPNL